MRYGESAFDILYLLFAITGGCLILIKARSKTEKQMGCAALILGCGDAFHLIPRVMNYFSDADFTAALGIGKLVTSVTMTIFYLLMYQIWLGYYREQERKSVSAGLWILLAVRIVLCMFPQNGWLTNSGSVLWGVIRNVPFIALGAIICWLYYTRRQADKLFAPVWIYILLSFLFYIPVAVGASIVPMLGMLMLPKTICYILLICVFRKAVLGQK